MTVLAVTTFDGLPLVLANGIGVVGVVFIVGWMVWSGRLVPRPQVDAERARHIAEMDRLVRANEREMEDANHERSEWRTEARLNQQAVVELSEQNRAMLTAFGPTLTDFLEKLRTLATQLRGQGLER